MLRLVVIAAACLAACGDDPSSMDTAAAANDVSSDGDAIPDVPPTPWIYPEDEDEVRPALSVAALESALETAMEAALELDPRAVADLHELLYPKPDTGSGDPTGCPFFLTYDYGTAVAWYWQGECTASDGTAFSGSGLVALYDGFVDEAGTSYDGFDVNLAGRIESADGTWLEASGQAAGYFGTAAQLTATVAVLDGTFQAGGPRAPASPWLDGTRRPALTVNGWTYLPTGGTNVTVSGGIAGLAFPDGVTAVALDELTAREALAGATCERELGGGAGVRGADGNWYDMLFDGALGDVGATPAELCDGCGTTWFRGEEVGATCVAAQPYFKWGAEP